MHTYIVRKTNEQTTGTACKQCCHLSNIRKHIVKES